jgi:hypothetical protein
MCAKVYTKEEQELALKEFERLGSVTAVIHKLGYPSREVFLTAIALYIPNPLISRLTRLSELQE